MGGPTYQDSFYLTIFKMVYQNEEGYLRWELLATFWGWAFFS